jgi:4-amino-4-deoxy-L-arabinose transferase-like glycosyltransferase
MRILAQSQFVFILAVITLLAVGFRFPYLSSFPPAMQQDEVALGYNAISIAETGLDEWGQRYPLVFTSFGDYKPPGFVYATSVIYLLTGWHPVLPRLTSALAGSLIVVVGALWIRRICKSRKLGLFAGLVLALSPWTIQLSRMALESNLGLLFFMLGLLFYEYAKKSWSLLMTSVIFFTLSTYTYHSFRFAVFLYFAALLMTAIVLRLAKHRQLPAFSTLKQPVIVLLLTTLLTLPGIFASGSTNRFDQTFLGSKESASVPYLQYRDNCHTTLTTINPSLVPICRLHYNKFTNPLMILSQSFLKHLSPAFAFIDGDASTTRNPSKTSAIFVGLLPLWFLGIYVVIRHFDNYYPLAVGYLITLIPSALTGAPHATRLGVHLPFLLAVIALGFSFLYQRSKWLAYLITLSLFPFAIAFALNFAGATYAGSQVYLSHGREIAYIMYQYQLRGYHVYAETDLFSEPHIYYAYWNQVPPQDYHQLLGEVSVDKEGFTRPLQLGDRIFIKDLDIQGMVCDADYTQSTIYITKNRLPLVPLAVVTNFSGALELAFVYDLDEVRKEQVQSGLCD